MRGPIFICHATEDAAVAAQLVDALEGAGYRCWIAPRDIPGGAVYADEIIGAIRSASMLLLLFSEYAEQSQHTQREAEAAARFDVPILPARLDSTPIEGAWVYFIGSSQWIEAPADRSALRDRVVKATDRMMANGTIGRRRDEAEGQDQDRADVVVPPPPPDPRRKGLIAALGVLAVVAIVGLGILLIGGSGDGSGGGGGGSTTTTDPPVRRPTPRQVAELDGSIRNTPVVLGNRVVVGSDDGLISWVKRSTGETAMTAKTFDPKDEDPDTRQAADVGSVTIDGRDLFVASNNGSLWAFNTSNAFPDWHVNMGATAARPVVVGDQVVIGDANGVVHCVNRDTGKARSTQLASGRLYANPTATSGGLVILPSWDRSVYAIDPATCAPAWDGPAPTGGQVWGGATEAGRLLLVGSWDGKLHALDAATGAPRWKADVGAPVMRAPVVTDDGLVIVSAGRPKFEGQQATDGVVAAYDLDGKQQWRADLPVPVVGSPVVHGDVVYVVSADGKLRSYGLQGRDGEADPRDIVPLGNGSWSTPTLDGDDLLVGTDDGRLMEVALPPDD